jgi:AcrR family transcriptional regulator
MDDGGIRSVARDDRRQAILEIARQVFLEEGYAAASMSAIAARVGGSKGTLYNYFPSKEALFAAVIQNYCSRVQAELFDVDWPNLELVEALRRFGRRYVSLLLSEEVIAMHRIVVAESTRFPEVGRALDEAGPRQGLRRMTAYIAEAATDGRLTVEIPGRAAEQFMDLCLTGLYRNRLWNVGPSPTRAQMEANVESALAVFMTAYGRRPE